MAITQYINIIICIYVAPLRQKERRQDVLASNDVHSPMVKVLFQIAHEKLFMFLRLSASAFQFHISDTTRENYGIDMGTVNVIRQV